MKGEITLRALEAIEEGITSLTDLIVVFLSAGYGASYGKITREFEKRHFARKSITEKLKNEVKSRQRLYDLLYRLKKDKLVSQKENRFELTVKGKEKIKALKERKLSDLSVKNYKKEKSKKLNIVIFDIPETDRRKRSWLRLNLISLGFKMLQKSVWAGNYQLPEEFIEDICDHKIDNHVEFFAANKAGTLRRLF